MVNAESELDPIFDEYGGTSELAKRLDEFMKSKKKNGKPIHVLNYYNGIRNAINKVFNKTLQFTDVEEPTRCSILDTLLEIIIVIVDFSPEGKMGFKTFVPVCMDLIMDKKKTFLVRVEIVKFLNSVIESYGKHGGLSVEIESLPFVQNFETLLAGAGDAELQLSMTELSFRLLSRDERAALTETSFNSYPEVKENFRSIRDEEFEQDCRKFINSLNENQVEKSSVYSLRCKAAYLGMFKNGNWETVVIRCKHVTETKLLDKKEEGVIVLILKLNQCVQTLLSFCSKTTESYVKLVYAADNSPVRAASLLFNLPAAPTHSPLSPDVVSCTPPKTSIAINAVHLSSRSKGYTKTVPMLTRKRRNQERVSGDDDSKTSADGSDACEVVTKGKRDKQGTRGQLKEDEDEIDKTENPEVSEENEGCEEDADASDSRDAKDNGDELGGVEDLMKKAINDVSKDSGIIDDSEVYPEDSVDHMEDIGKYGDQNCNEVDECAAGKRKVNVDNMDTREQTRKEWNPEDNFAKDGDSHESDGGRTDIGDSDGHLGLSGSHEVVTKTKRGKAAKRRANRSKPLPKKGQTKSCIMSTSESECNGQNSKIGEDMVVTERNTGIGTRTRSKSKETDSNIALGTGYNTEDWVLGEHEIERRQQKKKTLERTNGSKRLSQSRLSLIKNVFRETYDARRKSKKSLGPFEFRCSPPAKKTKGGLTLLRPAKTKYQKNKMRVLDRKREKKLQLSIQNGDVTVIPDSQSYHKKNDEEATCSDFASKLQWDEDGLEETKKRSYSESEILKRNRQKGLNGQKVNELVRKLKKQPTLDSGEEMVSGRESVERESENEEEKENEENGDIDDNKFNPDVEPVFRNFEPDELDFNLTQDYMADNQNDDVTCGLDTNGQEGDNPLAFEIPLGDLINEYLGISGDLPSKKDVQDKEGFDDHNHYGQNPHTNLNDEREIVDEEEGMGTHGINEDTGDNGGKIRGRHESNEDTEDYGGKIRGYRGINEDTEDTGGSGRKDDATRKTAKTRGRRQIISNSKNYANEPKQLDKASKKFARGKGRERMTGDVEEEIISNSKNHANEPKELDKASKKFARGKGRERVTGDLEEVGGQQVNSEDDIEPLLIISDNENEDEEKEVAKQRTTRNITHITSQKTGKSLSSFENNKAKSKIADTKRSGAPKIQRSTPAQRREESEEEVDEEQSDSECAKGNAARRSPRLQEKEFRKLVGRTLSERSHEEDEHRDQCHMTEDDVNVIEEFKNNLAKIIAESTRQRSVDKSPSPQSWKKKTTKKTAAIQEQKTTFKNSSESCKKSKTSLQTSRDSQSNAQEYWQDNEEVENDIEQRKAKEISRRESPKRKERRNTNPFEFDIRTPKCDRSRTTDSGFFDKTPASSSRKRTSDSRDQTPVLKRTSNTRDETSGEISKKPRRFGWLDVKSASNASKGYRSNEEKRSYFRQKDTPESPEKQTFAFSQRTSEKVHGKTTEGKKRKESDRQIGFVSGPFSAYSTKLPRNRPPSPEDNRYDFYDEPNINMSNYSNISTNFQTPGNDKFVPIGPRKLLFQSGGSMQSREEQEYEEEDEAAMDDTGYNDDFSIGDEVQMTLTSLGQDMKKTIRKRQNYVNQMANSSMKLIINRSQQIWTRHSSKRKKLMGDYASRVDKYIQEHQEVSARKKDSENKMLSQLMKHLETVSNQRKEQEKCLRNVIKTQKAFTEAFNCLEGDTESEQEGLQTSLRKEMLRYRDQVVKEVQKQEISNIKRRIQAMIGAPL